MSSAEKITLMSSLQTPVCELLGCDVPVVLAGMGGVARADLAAAVTEAGGFAFLGMVREPPTLIEMEIARVRAVTARPFGVNLIPAATEPGLLEVELATVLAARVAAVMLFWDLLAPAPGAAYDDAGERRFIRDVPVPVAWGHISELPARRRPRADFD